MKNTIKAAVVALAMSALAAGGVSANTYFWRSGPHLLPLPSSVTDPGEGEPTAQHITLSHDMPSEVIAGQGYSAHLAVSGNDGRALTYSVEPAVPVFISVTSDGEILIDPIAADAGEHAGIVFTVFDGTTRFHTDPVSMTVLPASGAFSLPLVASGDGTSLDRSLVFDGNDATKVTLSANGDSVVATYPAPIAAKGALVSASGNASFAIDALVGSTWKTAAASGVIGELDQDVNAVDGRSLVSAKWRLRKVSGGSMDLREFRPGSAPANPVPVFDLPSAALASNGESAVISAFSPSTYYSSAPVTVAMAPGTVVPTGVTLGADGTLSVAADAILSGGTWNFDVVATDGSGFKATRGYSVISVADMASTIMAKDFSNDGTAVDYRGFYDGGTASVATVGAGKALVVDFGVPVKFDKVYAAFGGAQSLRIEYESDGQWLVGNSASSTGIGNPYAGDVSMPQPLVARRIRAVNTGSGSLALAEFRVGSGPAYAAPSIDQSGVIATLSGSPTTVTLTATVANFYSNVSGPSVFSLVSGSLPSGASLADSGALSLPASSANDSGSGWTATIRVTDAAGFASEKVLQIAVPAVLASETLPTKVTRHSGTTDKVVSAGSWFDGLVSTVSDGTLTGADYLEFDYGRPVKFTHVYSSQTQPAQVSYLSGSQWISTGTSFSGTSVNAFGQEITTTKVRVSIANGGSLNEFRLGNSTTAAPTQQSPAFTAISPITLDQTGKSVQLVSDFPAAAYPAVTARSFVYLSGTLPSGASLSSGGLLTLPAAGSGEQIWDAVIRITDTTGFFVDAAIRVQQNIPADAATVLPVAMKKGATFNTAANLTSAQIALMYDLTSSLEFTSTNYAFVDFGQNVTASAALVYANGASVSLYYDAGTGGTENWTLIKGNIAQNLSTNITFPSVTARKFMVTIPQNGNASLYALRIGGGPRPLATLDQTSVTLQAGTASSVQLSMSPSSAYGPAVLNWTLVSNGGLAGVSINASTGQLTLPSRPTATTPTSWSVQVKAIDTTHGFASSNKTLTVIRGTP